MPIGKMTRAKSTLQPHGLELMLPRGERASVPYDWVDYLDPYGVWYYMAYKPGPFSEEWPWGATLIVSVAGVHTETGSRMAFAEVYERPDALGISPPPGFPAWHWAPYPQMADVAAHVSGSHATPLRTLAAEAIAACSDRLFAVTRAEDGHGLGYNIVEDKFTTHAPTSRKIAGGK